MNVACPKCGNIHDVTGFASNSVIRCSCGQPFRVPPEVAEPVAKPITPESQPAPGMVQQPIRTQAPPKATPGTLIASLIMGVMSFFTCGFLLSIPGLILGYSARSVIDANPETHVDRSVGTAAIVINWISIIVSVLFVALFIILGIIGAAA